MEGRNTFQWYLLQLVMAFSCRRNNVQDQSKYNTVEYRLFKSFKYQGEKLWNGLNKELKSAVYLNNFKMLFISWLLPVNVLYVRCVILNECNFMQFHEKGFNIIMSYDNRGSIF